MDLDIISSVQGRRYRLTVIPASRFYGRTQKETTGKIDRKQLWKNSEADKNIDRDESQGNR